MRADLEKILKSYEEKKGVLYVFEESTLEPN
jgi:hypothetical protein